MKINELDTRLSINIVWVAIAIGIGVATMLAPISSIMMFIGIIIIAILAIHTPLTILALLLTLAPLRTLIATESDIALPLDIGQLLLVMYLGSWLSYRVYTRKTVLKIKPSITLSSIIVLAIVLGLNLWGTLSISAWITEWLKWVVIGLLVWQLTVSEQHNWQWLIFIILMSAFANALVGLYIFFGGSGADHLVIGGRFFRAFGTFGQPNPYGGFMGIVLPISLMSTYSQIQKIWNCYKHKQQDYIQPLILLTLFSLSTAILLSALIASWSRGAWLGFVLSVGIMAFAIPRRLSLSISLASGLIVLIITLGIGGIIPQSIINRITTSATDFITIEDIRGVDITSINYAVVERVAHWQAAINMAESNPLMGVGLGSYEIAYDNYRLINWHEPLGHAHNYYLNILAEAGVVGFLVYVIFWIIIFVMTWAVRQHPDNFSRAIAIGLLGSWTYIATHSLFDNLYVNNLFLHIGVLLSILAILSYQLWNTKTLE